MKNYYIIFNILLGIALSLTIGTFIFCKHVPNWLGLWWIPLVPIVFIMYVFPKCKLSKWLEK